MMIRFDIDQVLAAYPKGKKQRTGYVTNYAANTNDPEKGWKMSFR